MSRDYKHSHTSRPGVGTEVSAATGFAIGLAIGLGVAVAVYLHGRKALPEPPSKPEPAVRTRDVTDEKDKSADDQGRKFDFYEMLPKFEVVVPEREKAVASDAKPDAIQRPGAYVLQAGSYRNFADADRVRVQLQLQGIESKVQRITVDNDTWHRVRIGPISDLTELNRTREKLRQADVPAIVVKVGE